MFAPVNYNKNVVLVTEDTKSTVQKGLSKAVEALAAKYLMAGKPLMAATCYLSIGDIQGVYKLLLK